MAIVNYLVNDQNKLIKTVFGDYLEKQFIMTSPIFGTMKRIIGPFGKEKKITFRGSVGSGLGASAVNGDLPESNNHKVLEATLTTKRFYGTVTFDNEAIVASKTSVDAFVSLFKEHNEVLVTAFNLDKERQLIRNDIAGLGILVSSSATPVTGNGSVATPYLVTLNTVDPLFMLEEGHLVNIGPETTKLEVAVIDDVAKVISLVGTSAILAASAAGPAAIPADDSRNVYMQGSRGQEWGGLLGVLSATSGTYKGQAISRRFQASQINAAAAAISTSLLNRLVIDMITKTGVKPTMILLGPEQFRRYIDTLESAKRYNTSLSVPAKGKFAAEVSYEGIEFMSSLGPVPIVQSRFVPSTVAMALNTDHIELHMREEFKWMAQDQTNSVMQQVPNKDQYTAYYGGYSDLFINPHFQGIISNLSVA